MRSFLVLLTIICLGCSPDVPSHDEFVVGVSRASVSSRYGEPYRTQVLTKSGESIWGPIEGFWISVPMGATVEIWSFQSVNEGRRGETELYFVDDADIVDGIGFQLEGAVYEGR